MLTKEQILSATDYRIEKVPVPEWGEGEEVTVKSLTGAERDEYETSVMIGKGKDRDVLVKNLRAKLVVRTLVDDEGKRLFQDGDAQAVGQKSAKAIDRIFGVAQRLSGLTDDDVKELEENLKNDQSDGSTSA